MEVVDFAEVNEEDLSSKDIWAEMVIEVTRQVVIV
jgi:hypothetical protein